MNATTKTDTLRAIGAAIREQAERLTQAPAQTGAHNVHGAAVLVSSLVTLRQFADRAPLGYAEVQSAIDAAMQGADIEAFDHMGAEHYQARTPATPDAPTDSDLREERRLMPAICSGWQSRAAHLGLPNKGAKRESDCEAYMQGAMAALVAAGIMSPERAGIIAFLTSVGRLPKYVSEHAARYVEPPKPAAQG